MPKTKIICTLGPASEKPGVLLKMMRAGMDVVRLNFSHGTFDSHLQRIRAVRALNKKYRRHIRILADLEGYRVRVGVLKAPMELKKSQQVWLSQGRAPGDGNVIPFDYKGPLEAITKGKAIYIDDGNIALISDGIDRNMLKTRVVVGGWLKSHKGVNMPDVKLAFKGITDKDKECLAFALEHQVDFVAQSFVRDQNDILALKTFIKGRNDALQIIAKIENREGIRNIDKILAVCDGIMIARGDMGVSLPVYEVPMIQKDIIRKCNKAGKFVITATQMLESMVERRMPTRAEVSDVANAILDGTDYVMLSAESAVGHDPAGTVDMMNHVIKFTEENR